MLVLQGRTWRWLENNALEITSAVSSAIGFDNSSGKRVFQNSIIIISQSETESKSIITFGNGEICDKSVIDDIAALSSDLAVAFEWQKGDLLLLDNNIVQHSRESYEGPRRLLVGLGKGLILK